MVILTEKTIDVTFTAEIQQDGRVQIPKVIRKAHELIRGDGLEITINKKL